MLYILWNVTIAGQIDQMVLYVRRDTKAYLLIYLELYKLYFLNRTDLKLFEKSNSFTPFMFTRCCQTLDFLVVKYKGVVIL